MLTKFKDVSDDDIVFMYKAEPSDDLEAEIMNRYKIHAKKLAGEIFKKFKFLYQVEFEDIYCIGLASIFVSIRGFKNGMKGFFQYWKICATRDIHDYISQFSINDLSYLPHINEAHEEERNYFKMMRQTQCVLNDEYALFTDLARIMENKKYGFSKLDQDIFYFYVSGYSIHEIALHFSLKYSTTRRRLTKLKEKIADILFNQ